MLEVRHLTKLYTRRPAVDDVSFTIRPGEILGYLGPNGSGKSTTVKMLTGLLEPSRGLILYQGRNIRQDLIGYKKSLGYVPEEPNLYPYLTGREYLQLVGRLRCLPAAPLESRIDQLLNLLSLHEHRYSPISSYSKGMKQRVKLAQALVGDPRLLRDHVKDRPGKKSDLLILSHDVAGFEAQMIGYGLNKAFEE